MSLFNRLIKEHGLFKSTINQIDNHQNFVGYASGVDAANRYAGNQARWLDFSQEVMNELIKNISQNTGE